MPLIKKLCIKCVNKIYGWNDVDENWGKGYVLCPHKYIGKGEKLSRKTTDKPPDNCPLLLEHILTQGKTNNA